MYGLGEIILVVIGILIALQINNEHESFKNKRIEESYLLSIKEDIKKDISAINAYILDEYELKLQRLELGRDFYKGEFVVNDTISFINDLQIAGEGPGFIWSGHTNTFNELESTGNLRKIRNDSLRKKIIEYYSRLKIAGNKLDKYNTQYADFINSIQYQNNDIPAKLDSFDKNYFMEKVNSSRFYQVCNLEITIAGRTRVWATIIVRRANELLNLIDDYFTTL
ncbi:DUF6090 family protein [Altibacter lentus]|uniref:DUF6090 family protein n=1 Tax=Altibacter lentus TaxID=1223410 RepID=UPI0012686BD1|nr:DUF6090 family protein [Altibacter lentus]